MPPAAAGSEILVRMIDITSHVTRIAEQIHALRNNRSRLLVAIAGAPGSGKSTLAGELNRRLNAQKCPSCVVPMDGFHLDNRVLAERGLQSRKGAPQTFDAEGFVHLVARLRGGAEVVYPVFDRPRDIAIAGAGVVTRETRVVLVEGNYLLFDAAPWSGLASLWDLSVRLDVALPELRARLIQRWLSHGLSRAAATRRAEANDIPNAAQLIEKALPADIIL